MAAVRDMKACTMDEVQAMRAERAKGRTLRQIAEQTGRSVTTVFNYTRGVILEGGDVPAARLRGRGEIVGAANASTVRGKG